MFGARAHIPEDKQYSRFRARNSHSNDHIKAIYEDDLMFSTDKRLCLIDWPLSSRGAKLRTLVAFSAVINYASTQLVARYEEMIEAGADCQVESELQPMMAGYMDSIKAIRRKLRDLCRLLDEELQPEWNWMDGLKAQVQLGKELKVLEEALPEEMKEGIGATCDRVVKEEKHRRRPFDARYF